MGVGIDLERFKKVWDQIIFYFTRVMSIIFGGISGQEEEPESSDNAEA